jgi:hypothetical protein
MARVATGDLVPARRCSTLRRLARIVIDAASAELAAPGVRPCDEAGRRHRRSASPSRSHEPEPELTTVPEAAVCRRRRFEAAPVEAAPVTRRRSKRRWSSGGGRDEAPELADTFAIPKPLLDRLPVERARHEMTSASARDAAS